MRRAGELAPLVEPERRPHVAPLAEGGAAGAERARHDQRRRPAARRLGRERGPSARAPSRSARAARRRSCRRRSPARLPRRAPRRAPVRRRQPCRTGAASVTTSPSGLGAGGGEVAEVDRCGPEAEIAPGDPVEPEVHALDERVLGDDAPAGQLGRVVLDPLREAAPLELGEQAELADVSRAARRSLSTSTGPSPAPISARPVRDRARGGLGGAACRVLQRQPARQQRRRASPSACSRRRGSRRRRGARPESPRARCPSKRWSTGRSAVAAGDDHRRRAERVQRARPAVTGSSLSLPCQRLAPRGRSA